MKYSIRGRLSIQDDSDIIAVFNKYTLWRLTTSQNVNRDGSSHLSFEVWLNTEEDKDTLFEEIKPFVDEYGELVDWHECTHDETIPRPCIIADEYRGV